MPHPVFEAAYAAWNSGSDLRSRRRRYKNFTYGRQWDDLTCDEAGRTITEGDYARLNGRTPLTNNLIRQLVKNIVGRWRRLQSEESTPREALLREASTLNALPELDARLLEEFLISGCAVQRVVSERRPQARGVHTWVDNVSPERFFVSPFTDPRGWDVELLGMLHDMSLTEAIMRYGHGDPLRERAITEAFTRVSEGADARLAGRFAGHYAQAGTPQAPGSFTMTTRPGRFRVVEVWTLESRRVLRCHDRSTGAYYLVNPGDASRLPQGVSTRPETTLVWRFRIFAADGTLIDSGDSPYAHSCHPFIIKYFPLTDGEVHSFVEDVVDQQRHLNRLITLIDSIMSHSAKGVLLFPVTAKPEEMNWNDVVGAWTRVNGVLPYDPRSVAKPEQIVNNGSDAGAYALVKLEMELIDRISGINSAMRGESASASEGSAHFISRLESSTSAILDILESFSTFRRERDAKLLGSAILPAPALS